MSRNRPLLVEWAILLLVTAIGAALRLYAIGDMPAGLYQDEAYNGLDALGVLEGARPIYFPANNGREPFYIYLTSLSVAALGRTPAAVRLPAAFVGILTIPATYALGRALFSRRAGLLAAAICAATFWPVALSRIGLRAGSLPLLAALSLACAAWGWRRGRLGLVAVGGALYGLSFYTYLAVRVSVAALSIFLIFWYIATQRPRHDLRRGTLRLYLAAFALPAFIVVTPLATYAANHPEIVIGRLDQVSVLNPAINGGNLWGTLFNNSLAALGMFVWRGDTIARHNLPGRPVFDPLIGAAFVFGVLLCLRRAFGRGRDPAAALPLMWTAVMLAPTVLAEDTPHFLRAVGVLPFIFLFPALALEKVWGWSARQPIGRFVVVGAMAISFMLTVRDYFGRYATDPNTGYEFQSAATVLAKDANTTLGLGWTSGLAEAAPSATPGRVYVDRRLWDNFPSLRFLIPAGDRVVVWEAAQPPAIRLDGAASLFVWPYEDSRPILSQIPPEMIVAPSAGPLAKGDLEPSPYSLFAEYRLRPWPPNLISGGGPWIEFENGIQLHGQAVSAAGGQIVVTLAWLSGETTAPGQDLQVFVHAVTGGEIVTQDDGPLGMGVYPSSGWRPRQVIEETRRLRLPPGTRPGEIMLRIGLYDPASGARLSRADSQGDSVDIVLEEQHTP